MSKDYDVGDMLIALSKESKLKDDFHRVFLYLITKILENPLTRQEPLSFDYTTTIEPENAIKDIQISSEVYSSIADTIATRGLLRREIPNNQQELWSMERNRAYWQVDPSVSN